MSSTSALSGFARRRRRDRLEALPMVALAATAATITGTQRQRVTATPVAATGSAWMSARLSSGSSP